MNTEHGYLTRRFENPPSEMTVRAWEKFEELTGLEFENEQARSTLVSQVFHDFALVKHKPIDSDVIRLYKLVELLEPGGEYRQQARLALNEYAPNDPEQRIYVAGITSDFPIIERFIRGFEHEQEESSGESTAAARDYHNPWDIPQLDIPKSEMYRLIAGNSDGGSPEGLGVNIESIVIKAADAYVTVRDANKEHDDEKLAQTVREIDGFYRPMLELMGYDAFAMALKREATLLKMSKHIDVGFSRDDLLAARTQVEKLADREKTRHTVQEVLSSILYKTRSTRFLNDSSDHGIQFGAGEFTGTSGVQARYAWRVKTDVSAAEGIAENKADPHDVLGITVIVDDEDVLPILYSMAILRSSLNKNFGESTHASGEKAFSIKGGLSFLHKVKEDIEQLDLHDLGQFQDKVSSNGHEVAKFIVQYRSGNVDIPVEIQFQTEAARLESRIGEPAHANKEKKYNEQLDQIKFQKLIHERRNRTNAIGLTAASRERAIAVLEQLRRNYPETTRSLGRVSFNP